MSWNTKEGHCVDLALNGRLHSSREYRRQGQCLNRRLAVGNYCNPVPRKELRIHYFECISWKPAGFQFLNHFLLGSMPPLSRSALACL